MLLNWDRTRMNGPRFLPSGSRLGPNFCSRADASLAASPVSLLVLSRLETSAADIACQLTTSPAVFGFALVLMDVLRRADSPVPGQSARPCRNRRTHLPRLHRLR